MKLRVTSRQIAKMLVRRLPLDDKELAGKVGEYIKQIEAIPKEARLALQSAYIFSSKVPVEEREDMFQELTLKTLEALTHQRKEGSVELFAYLVAGNKWRSWIRDTNRHKRIMPIDSLNEVTVDEDRNEVELINTLVGEAEFESKVVAKLDAQRIWDKLPDTIKPIIKKRLQGKVLLDKERSKLKRFRRKYKLTTVK